MMKEKSTPRILVVGSLVMDLIVKTSRFPDEGETVLGSGFTTAPGGKGANQAVQAVRLGAEVTLCGQVGNDEYGRMLLRSCSDNGINISHVGITDRAPTAIGNVQLESGSAGSKNRIIVVSGANMTLSPQDVAFLRDEMQAYDMVMLQLEIPMEVTERVAAYAADAGIPVMLNTAPYMPLPKLLLPKLTYVSPNEHEAEHMTGISIHTLDDAKTATQAILDMGVQNVLITLGNAGAAFRGRGGFLYSPAIDGVDVREPTAAGDSFVGAFCVARCRGMDIQDALLYANYSASVTVSRHGAQPSLPTSEEVDSLMRGRAVGKK